MPPASLHYSDLEFESGVPLMPECTRQADVRRASTVGSKSRPTTTFIVLYFLLLHIAYFILHWLCNDGIHCLLPYDKGVF